MTVWLVDAIMVEVVGIVIVVTASQGSARTRNQSLDVSQLATAGAGGRKCTNVHCISPPRYTASQRFPKEAFVLERLRGEALRCVIRQDGVRIKYLVPYILALFGHVAGVSSREASIAGKR